MKMENKYSEFKLKQSCKVPHMTSGSIIKMKCDVQYIVRTNTHDKTENKQVKWNLTVETTDSQSEFSETIPTVFKCL